MSNQVTRLESGGMIQIRTGVIQGIGPQGPTGATGPQGETGPQGAQGIPGPVGVVEEFSSYFTASQAIAATTVTSNLPTAYTSVQFGTVDHDELSTQQSTTNFTFAAGADYNLIARIRFAKNSGSATGFRAIQVLYNSVEIASTIVTCSTATDTVVSLPVGFRSTSGTDVMQIKVAHNETASLNITGSLWVNRTGPGVQGPQGIQGIQGAPGDVGPQGPIGPPGSLISNTTTIADIGGTNPA